MFDNVPVWVLRPSTIENLGVQLNQEKILLSDEGHLRDWRGICELANISSEHGFQAYEKIRLSANPFQEFLTTWRRSEGATIQNFLNILGEIDRYDVIDDNHEKMCEDVVLADKIAREKGMDLQQLQTRIAASETRDLLTYDDIRNAQSNLGLAHYDAFVLYGEGDEEFLEEVVELLERQGLKVCIKDRDLLGGCFEHEAVMKLISERCSRLVPILSPNFFNSQYNNFLTLFAQTVAIKKEERKIIPVIYKDCEIPSSLDIYHKIHKSNFYFQKKLCQSINENIIFKPPEVSSASNGQKLPSSTVPSSNSSGNRPTAAAAAVSSSTGKQKQLSQQLPSKSINQQPAAIGVGSCDEPRGSQLKKAGKWLKKFEFKSSSGGRKKKGDEFSRAIFDSQISVSSTSTTTTMTLDRDEEEEEAATPPATPTTADSSAGLIPLLPDVPSHEPGSAGGDAFSRVRRKVRKNVDKLMSKQQRTGGGGGGGEGAREKYAASSSAC